MRSLLYPLKYSLHFIKQYLGHLSGFKRRNDYLWDQIAAMDEVIKELGKAKRLSSSGAKPKLETPKAVAYDSPDHITPWGTSRDNSKNWRFNLKLRSMLKKDEFAVLDLGCSGGGFVRSLLDMGAFAVGIEGSDYSQKHKRAEWPVIPENLFTSDITVPFRVLDRQENRPIQFDVVTAWEVIEHIKKEDLEKLMTNIRNHLKPGGFFIGTVNQLDDIVDGVNLHQTIKQKPWWMTFFDSQGFTMRNDLVEFFGSDMVRTEDDSPGTFPVVLQCGPPPKSTNSGKERAMSDFV